MVQGWRQGNGTLWQPNQRVIVFDPVCGFDNTELLVSEVTFTQDQNGTLTEIRVGPPDAYLPEPEAPGARKRKSQSTGGPVLMRTIEAMQRQLLGLIGRAVVKSISAATKCQTVDVSLIAGEPKAGVEHLEPYGFTARANSGAEAVVLFPDGDRSHAVVVTVSDRRYRLKGLQTGEVAVYDDQGQSVTLTREGIVVDGAGKTITFRNAPEARFEMDLEVTGQVKDLCDSGGTTMSAMRLAYNGHRHRENGQGSNTDKPDKAMEA